MGQRAADSCRPAALPPGGRVVSFTAVARGRVPSSRRAVRTSSGQRLRLRRRRALSRAPSGDPRRCLAPRAALADLLPVCSLPSSPYSALAPGLMRRCLVLAYPRGLAMGQDLRRPPSPSARATAVALAPKQANRVVSPLAVGELGIPVAHLRAVQDKPSPCSPPFWSFLRRPTPPPESP